MNLFDIESLTGLYLTEYRHKTKEIEGLSFNLAPTI
jgi:hypothetical protein